MDTPSHQRRQRRHVALLLVLASFSIGSLAGGAMLYAKSRDIPRDELLRMAIQDPDIRREAADFLITASGGVHDVHLDAQVTKVLQADIKERSYSGTTVSTNAYGLRERPFAMPKEDDTVRVVLLGDSMIFGWAVDADERLGVHLERMLVERNRAWEGRIEVLHFGITSWNIEAECNYVRRQLSDLQPDLVVQVVLTNDLCDCNGVRGFGTMGMYTPQERERANGLTCIKAPWALWGLATVPDNPLVLGVDQEGRERYAAAAAELGRLARMVEQQGGRYLCIAKWDSYLPLVEDLLVPELRPEQWVGLAKKIGDDRDLWINEGDYHWNPKGHELIARLLYGLIQERGLLPKVDPAPWEDAQAVVDHNRTEVDEQLRTTIELEEYLALLEILPRIDVAKPDLAVKQVYGGIEGSGWVAPYASVILGRTAEGCLTVEGHVPDRPELTGATEVRVEGIRVGEIPLTTPGPFRLTWDLPAEALDRAQLNVRFVSADYVHRGVANAMCGAFLLKSLYLEER